ncbi:4Fe-4S binding protein [Desulfoplanes formicivorans]|uniref:4Fe-4S ferredoxin n=1 Tax=Desulfoplanes formicivorans TaxID=1592317 RepID=A0A194AHQ1_9BACT|nr:4Fe-4S binding protein [Desulfoplanes formicivorans]GAU08606.1 4Fe-4S ferredoxin [Desulfoplanes formicivorans]
MGHIIAKDIYRQLGEKIDNTTVRTPWNPALRDLLQALYTKEEADFIVRMPYRPSSLERLQKIMGMELLSLQKRLESLCHKGLVCDIWEGGEYVYMVSPLVIGFFEFTMMRTKGELSPKKWAELFHAYMFGSSGFFDANFGDEQQVSIMRALPHEQTLGDHVEILDYEKAQALMDAQTSFAVGICSCRHEKEHLGGRPCDVPLETCTSMGSGAEFLIRNGFARSISREEMEDITARSRDMGFVLSTDNVRQDAGFICHCCSCCCNLLRGIRETGYSGILVSSSFMARCDEDLCNGCGQCVRACPIDAITLVEVPAQAGERPRKKPVVNEDYCLGCGVCGLKCPTKAMRLDERTRKVFHPEDSMERVILQSLERGTLQNLLFDNPNSRTQGFMRGLVGAFLRLSPVKKALMSEALRSRFLDGLRRAGG